jgi:hypothetical protein
MRPISPLWLFVGAMACAPSKMNLELLSDTGVNAADSDGDGIPDHIEGGEDIDSDGDGTPDYLDTDSDGDSWSDRDENDSYTDPQDASDHPYTGGWPIDACRNSIVPTGMEPGDIMDDVRLTDQNGEVVRLHDFCDHFVLIEHAGFD